MYEYQVEVCSVEKTKQALILWLALPDEHASNIKAKIFNESRSTSRWRGG